MNAGTKRVGGPEGHILKQLVFPSRFEVLVKYVGSEIARLLVQPPPKTMQALENASQAARARGEGIFLPLYAPSGEGKTTLANSLGTFFPEEFTTTVSHDGTVRSEELKRTASEAAAKLYSNDDRILPINVDHRESDPPNSTELSQIKRFLREPSIGFRTAILWPETSEVVARRMADDFASVAGAPPIPIPLAVQGPPRDTWVEIARHTLQLSNNVESLELLGVDPRDYSPDQFATIGEFLRSISGDFTDRRLELLREIRKPVRLAIVFVSESPDAGVLTQLTNSSRFGLMDGNALLDATRESVVGRWWRDRRGLLTQMTVQLDVRLFGLPPQASIPILRRFGTPTVVETLATLEVKNRPSSIKAALKRSDLGKYLNGTARPTYETRGTPAAIASPAFALLSEKGFTSGQDKGLNRAMLSGIQLYLMGQEMPLKASAAENGLGFVPLIPDNSFDMGDEVICIEYTWRKGDFLTNANRGNISQYVLQKLQNYARELNRA